MDTFAREFNQFKEQLNDNKVYFRQLSYNGVPMKHQIGLTAGTAPAHYIDGIELFQHGKFYYLKSYTIWAGNVCLNSVSKINKNGKITLFKINYFGITNGECRVPRSGVDKESYTYTNGYIDCINEYLNSEDELRRVIIKEKVIK
tara:strand:- start:374 stop:808 length:435 start_codon:yes stop_codon:yes gene_type:complete